MSGLSLLSVQSSWLSGAPVLMGQQQRLSVLLCGALNVWQVSSSA